MKQAYIKGVSYYLPEEVLTNEMISRDHPEWSVEKISAKTGIHSRHIASADEYSSDMAITAAEALIKEYNIDRTIFDYVILCTQSPDYFLPTTACILQERLSLPQHVGAIDFNLGCSGYVYGLGLAKGLIVSEQASNILLITAETYSKFMHKDDKSNKTLFGDAAAATWISNEPGEYGAVQRFTYGTDGSGAESLIVKNGGMRYQERNPDDTGTYLFMDGKAVFEFTVFKVPPLIAATLSKHEMTLDDIDLFIFHQANEFMLNTVRSKIGIPKEKFYIFLNDCGNTVSSTIPIALKEAFASGRIKKGDKVLLAGFGVGLSWGATILNF
jgi:3-oxoacyl-[acyl-carrier-protein] synthase-3